MKKIVYKFVERNDVTFVTTLKFRQFENEWLKVDDYGGITIKGSHSNGYAWNGCSPKAELLDLIIGTPDGKLDFATGQPVTYFASMLHDILYQFKDDPDFFVTRYEADLLFFDLMKQKKFFWSNTYFVFVRAFGWIFGRWNYDSNDEITMKVKKIIV